MTRSRSTSISVVLTAIMFAMPTTKAVTQTVQSLVGLASYCSHSHQGRRMANGEPFDDEKLTAASMTLPLGTRVKLTSLRTKRFVTVTITDRGPFAKKRIIDLSIAAARSLGMVARGVDRVRIEPLP